MTQDTQSTYTFRASDHLESSPPNWGTRGFTLIEMMITIAVLTILVTIAAPSYHDLVLNQRVKTAASDTYATLVFARSEAIKRNANVIITQASGGWKNGWTVADAGGNTLRTQAAYTNLAITGPIAAVAFGRNGRITTAAPFMVDASPANTNVTMRCIDVSLSGQPHSKLDHNGDKDCTNDS